MTKNMDMFNQYTARIFADLYVSFPIGIPLAVCELSGHHALDEFGRVLNEAGEQSQEFLVCKATIIWLEQSGYIRTGTDNEYGWHDCLLTAKGLEVLKCIPDTLNIKKTVGESLIDAAKTGSIQIAINLAKTVLSHGVHLGLKN